MIFYDLRPGMKIHHDEIGELKVTQVINDLFIHGTTREEYVFNYPVYFSTEHDAYFHGLVHAKKEYADQLSVQGQTGVEATRLNDYAKFITQLDDAIELQKHQLADAERAVIDKQKIWQGHYQRVESLSKVVQQNLNQENSIDRKKVERQLDDRAGTLSGNTVKPG